MDNDPRTPETRKSNRWLYVLIPLGFVVLVGAMLLSGWFRDEVVDEGGTETVPLEEPASDG